jgi:hypothetical protein
MRGDTPGPGPRFGITSSVPFADSCMGVDQFACAAPSTHVRSPEFLRSAGTGNAIGAPPGECLTVFYDGTNMNYVDLGRVGEQ